MLNSINKQIKVDKKTISVENFKNIFIEAPKIVHLFCQSEYCLKENAFFMQFEEP